MPYRDLTEWRRGMRELAGHSRDEPLPTYGGPARPGLWPFLVWLFKGATGFGTKRKDEG